MDRPALPQEDLFDTSTMTFGEHLDELRRALARAIGWLALGVVLALAFAAQPVVRMIQDPLEAAIYKYKVDRSLSRLGAQIPFDAESVAGKRFRDFMLENGLSWQQVYMLSPDDLRKPSPAASGSVDEEDGATAAEPAGSDAAAAESTAAESTGAIPIGVPDPSEFRPTWVLTPSEVSLNTHQVEEPFMILIKASVVVGTVLASPMIFYHLWSFIAAGLYPHERKYVHLYLPFSVALFLGGVCLAFFAVLRYVLEFLLEYNSTLSVDLEPRLSYYMSFVLLLPLGFGIAFQLPLVMLFLQRIGIFETSAYENSWRISVLVIAVLSMVLTPADPYSMILLMCPLVALYFLGIALCRYLPRGRGMSSAAYDPR